MSLDFDCNDQSAFIDTTDDELLAQIDIDFGRASGQSPAGESSSSYSLECDRILEKDGTPLQRYKPKPGYLVVSDLASQHWCEQQLLYDLSEDVYLCRVPAGEEVTLEEDVKTKIAKGKGSDIHLERELEIQVPVSIPVETREDKWAVKFLNLLSAVNGFYHGHPVAREIPVCGCPFDSDVFMYGIIDEIRYDTTSHSLEISELKTRCSNFPPKKSHQEKDKFQLSMYRQLFDELVLGKLTKTAISSHLALDLSRNLSEGVITHVKNLQKAGDWTVDCQDDLNLDCLLNVVLDKVQSLTRVASGRVEYVHQDTKLPIAVINLDCSEDELRIRFEEMCRWWKGERGTKGVDIEDCWKCQFCPFMPWCEWREVMAEKTSKHQTEKTGS